MLWASESQTQSQTAGALTKMTDVAELEKRLSAALDRIASGVAAMASPAPDAGDSEEVARLRESIESERSANAQLEQRVIAIKDKQEKLVANLEAEVARLRQELEDREATLHRVKRINQRLRENNRALREANRAALGDAELINTSMVTELDALRLSRETDRAELDTILNELKPLVEGGANA